MPPRECRGTWLALLKEVVPGAARVAVLSHPTRGAAVQALPPAAPGWRRARPPGEGHSPADGEGVCAARPQARADALFVRRAPLLALHRARMAALAHQHRLPAIARNRDCAEGGGLMTSGVRMFKHCRRDASSGDRRLQGAQPADLPVEQAAQWALGIHLTTAQALGLPSPPTGLCQAEEVSR